MYRPDKIMKAGTWADPDFNGAKLYNADGRTAVIDMGAATPTWRSTAPMAFGRAYQNLTMLADGTVLASGGMSTSDGTDLSKAVLPAEIWNPDTETWTTVASLTNGREYHSTALLLPDGRVLMAGGGALPGRATDQTNAEIYSPPYLFKGTRPTISSAPGGASWGSSFDITTPDAASITKVSLVRSPSVTHAFDQNQRFQFLNFTTGSGKITVQAPTGANVAPPGRLHAVHPERERRAVRGLVHPPFGHGRRHPAARAVGPRREPVVGAGLPDVERLVGPERHRELQRLPLDHAGLHAAAPPIESPSRPRRATRTSAGRRAPTTTRSPRTTPRATRALPRTR